MRKILVVDDEAFLADALGELLADEGFSVRAAQNGYDGLAQIEADPPDLVLLDWMMPVMDGHEMLMRMRQSPEHARIPVIMMTSVPRSAVRVEVDGWISKPFTLDQLLELLQQRSFLQLPNHVK